MSFIYARFLDAEYQSYGGIKADALQEVFQYSAFFMQINKRTFLLSANESCCMHGLRFVLYNYEIQKEYLVLL
jgi:phage-related protein